MNNIQKGRMGEEMAVDLACCRGYEILTRNYRCARGEIDLVLKDDDTIVFVEVKARTSARYGQGWEAVTWSKQQRIRDVATWYIQQYNYHNCQFRFDVISFQRHANSWQHRWFENAF